MPLRKGLLRLAFVSIVGLLVSCSVYDEELAGTGPGSGIGSPDGNGGAAGSGATGGGAEAGAGGGAGNGGGVGGQSGASGDEFTDPSVPVCGDGYVSEGEKCDTAIAPGQPGACPADCTVIDPCLPQVVDGIDCLAECIFIATLCEDDDGCCPAGCSNRLDNDCSDSCGDGIVQADQGETCETAGPQGSPDPEFPCPAQCEDDGDPCTVELLSGSAENCNAACSQSVITAIMDGDGCCPAGANGTMDNDCAPVCGNGVTEPGEECDGGGDCDDQCRFIGTPEERRCLGNLVGTKDTCRACMCASCTSQANDCFDSGEQVRDADCAEIVLCGAQNDCLGSSCYCGLDIPPDGTCLIGDGPCAAIMDRVAGIPGAATVFLQQFDLNTAIGRARAFSDCHWAQCDNVCP